MVCLSNYTFSKSFSFWKQLYFPISNKYLRQVDVYSGQTEPPIPVETEPLCFVI